jgi:hypothetical protein
LSKKLQIAILLIFIMVVSIIFINCTTTIPIWSIHGNQYIDSQNLTLKYMVRYQGSSVANKVTFKMTVKIPNNLLNEKEYTYNGVSSGDKIMLENVIPLIEFKNNFSIKDAEKVKTIIIISWIDSNGKFSKETFDF